MLHNMKKELKFLNIPFEVKSDSDKELIIEGHGAIKGNIDSYKDVIQDGAFKRTIKEQGERIAFCYQHDIWNPIGKIQEIKEDDKGLWIRVKISDAEGDIKTKIREGILKELSIGYSVIEAKRGEKDGEDVNFLMEIKLYEVSLVTLAANPLALVESMKADGKTTHEVIEDEFDNLIGMERNNNKKFEMLKLKALVLSLPLDSKGTETPPEVDDTIEDKPLMTKEQALLILKL